jgi:hypothetical protein
MSSPYKHKLRFTILPTALLMVLLLEWTDLRGDIQPQELTGKKVAVVVNAQNKAADRYVKAAHSRMESILADNDIVALDREKVRELTDVFKTLDDPGAFVTAEDFVENAARFEIAALVAIYLNVDRVPTLADYFSAGAHADIRFISESDAKVTSISLLPMGAPGRPPSDGLTQNSAAINAVQRAVDDACNKLGLENLDPATPRLVRLDLKGPVEGSSLTLEPRPLKEAKSISRYAQLEEKRWRQEEVTCTAKAPAGAMGAVAGYIIDTDFRRRPQRLYGSRIHLIDTRQKRGIQVFDCFGVEKKQPGEIGERKILDCMFISSWRYLAAVSGGKLFFWDTERGKLLAAPTLTSALKSARLGLARLSDSTYLVVDSGRKKFAFQLVRAGD